MATLYTEATPIAGIGIEAYPERACHQIGGFGVALKRSKHAATTTAASANEEGVFGIGRL